MIIAGLKLREWGMNVVEPNIALQFWNTMGIAMGEKLIQEEILGMVCEFLVVTSGGFFTLRSYQDVNDPPSSSRHKSVRLWSFLWLVIAIISLQLLAPAFFSFHTVVFCTEILCSEIKSTFFCHTLYELVDHITPTSCCAYHTFVLHFSFPSVSTLWSKERTYLCCLKI